MALEFKQRREGSITFVYLTGKITLGEASQAVRDTAEKLIEERRPQIVFNLKDVPFIDSAGLGALTLSYTKAKAAGGLLKLACPQARVLDALEMTRLTRLFPVFHTEDEAAGSFEAPTVPETGHTRP